MTTLSLTMPIGLVLSFYLKQPTSNRLELLFLDLGTMKNEADIEVLLLSEIGL